MAEQLICNQQVVGSTPITSSKPDTARAEYGRIPERPKGTDCKSAGIAFGGSNPPSPTKKTTSFIRRLSFFYPSRRLGMASRVSVYGIPTASGMASAVRLHFSFPAA